MNPWKAAALMIWYASVMFCGIVTVTWGVLRLMG